MSNKACQDCCFARSCSKRYEAAKEVRNKNIPTQSDFRFAYLRTARKCGDFQYNVVPDLMTWVAYISKEITRVNYITELYCYDLKREEAIE